MEPDTAGTNRKTFPLFFGSTVVLGCFLGMLGSNGALLFTSIGVMVNPLVEEFGWSRGDVSTGASFLTLGIIIGLLTTGPLIDRYGARRVLLVSVLLSIVVVSTLPFLVSGLGVFYLMMLIAATVGGPTNTSGYARVIASWFDRRRGLFIGINACGMGFGFALSPLVTNWAVSHYGWQAGYVCLALVMLLVVLPSVYFLIIDTPADAGLQVDGRETVATADQVSTAASASLDLKQAMRTPAFWLMLYIVAALAFALQGTLVHMVPLLVDRGVDATTAAFVVSFVGISMAFARFTVGFLLDHVFAPRLAMVVFSLAACSLVLILFTDYLPLYFLAAVLVGFGIGAEGDLMAYMVSRYFGMKNFALIFSVIFSSYIAGTGLGPAVFGRLFDSQGDYVMVHFLSIALMISAIVLFVFFSPYDHYLKNSPGRSA